MRSVGKNIPINAVSMEVEVAYKPVPVGFGESDGHAHEVGNSGHQHLALFEPAVEVLACEASPVVPQDHPVWVQHRHDFEN